jgi:hypothetical protein
VAYDAGTAFLSVVPSFAGAVTAIAAQGTEWGQVMGKTFKASFESTVQDLKVGVDPVLSQTDVGQVLSELDVVTADRDLQVKPTIGAAASAAYLAEVTALFGLSAALGGAAAGGGGGFGILGALMWGGGGPLAFTAGFGSIMGLMGFGLEHYITTAIGLIGSALGGLAGGGLLAAGGLGVLAVGMGSDMAVSASAIADTKTLGTAYTALQTAVLQYGADSVQAASATANLNLQMQLLGNTAGVLAELQLAKAVNALNSYWDQATSGARVAFANMVTPLLSIAYTYIPLVAAAATRNFGIIQQGLVPLIAYLNGPATTIFQNLENLFAERLPTAMNALNQGVQLLLKTINLVAPQTGGLMTSISNWLTKMNTPAGFAKWSTIVEKLIGMFHTWWDLLKQVAKTVYDLFDNSKGLGTGIVSTLTQMLKQLDTWLTSTSGKNSVGNLFEAHKNEVIDLMKAMVPLAASIGRLYLVLSPALINALTAVLPPMTAFLNLVVQMPFGVGAWTIAIVLITGKLGLLGAAVNFLTAGAIGRLITSFGAAAVAARDSAYSMVAAYAMAAWGMVADAGEAVGAWVAMKAQMIGTAIWSALSAGVTLVAGAFDLLKASVLGAAAAFAIEKVQAALAWVATLGPLALIIAGIALLIVGIVLLITHWKQVSTAVKNALGGIVSWIETLPGDFEHIGVLLVQGLWNGITSVAGWLKSKIEGLAGDVVGWAKGILGISSPSTVFAGIGANIGQGLASGLLAQTDAVTAAARKMLSGLTGTSLTASVGVNSGSIPQPADAALVASISAVRPVNLSTAAAAGGSVLAALQRIESAIHTEGAAPTGAAVSTKVNAQLGNVIQQHARTVVTLQRSGAR